MSVVCRPQLGAGLCLPHGLARRYVTYLLVNRGRSVPGISVEGKGRGSGGGEGRKSVFAAVWAYITSCPPVLFMSHVHAASYFINILNRSTSVLPSGFYLALGGCSPVADTVGARPRDYPTCPWIDHR